MRTRSSYLEPHSCRSTHMCTCSASKVVRTMDGKRKLMTLFNVGVTRVRRHCTTHAFLCFALLYGSYYWPLLSLIAPPKLRVPSPPMNDVHFLCKLTLITCQDVPGPLLGFLCGSIVIRKYRERAWEGGYTHMLSS